MLGFVLKLLALCLVCETSYLRGNGGNVSEFLSLKLELIENVTKNLSRQEIRLQKPASIYLNKTNTDIVKICKDGKDFLYVLKANKLLSVYIDTDNQIQMRFMAVFQPVVEDVVEMRISEWKSFIVIVLRFSSYLHVYLTKTEHSTTEPLQPVQKIKINSLSDRVVLPSSDNELFLVTQVNNKNNAVELSFYQWKTSFFSKESLEVIDFPSKSDLFAIDEATDGPLVLSIGYGNTTQVMVFQLDTNLSRLTKLQSLHFKQNYAEHYVYKRRLYLIACSTDSFCAVYRWGLGQFRRHLKINSHILGRIARIGYQHEIVAIHSFDNKIQLYATDNIVASQPGFIIDTLINSEYAIYKAPKTLYLVEFTNKRSSLVISFREMLFVGTLGENRSTKSDARNCSRQLKSFLKQRIPQVQASHQYVHFLAQHENILEKAVKTTLNAKYTSLSESNVKQIKMPFSLKSMSNAIRERIVNTAIMIARGKLEMKNVQIQPMTNRAVDEKDEELDSIIVQNLEHRSKENFLGGIQLKTQQQVNLNDQIIIRNATAFKIVLKDSFINRILISQLLNSTNTKEVSGQKVVKKIQVEKVNSLKMNNIISALMKPSIEKSWEISSEYEFKGKVNLRNLHVGILNGADLRSLFKNVYVQKHQIKIGGNWFVHNAITTTSLATKMFMDLLIPDLLTTSTHQSISSDIVVAKFLFSMLKTKSVNDEKLNQNVALANNVNFVEVPTQIMNVHILRNLNILEVGLSKTIENLKAHVIGTQTVDLAQIYSGIVVIQGSLKMCNVTSLIPRASFTLNDRVVPPSIISTFWTSSSKQEVLNENFLVRNVQLSAENAYLRLLSRHPSKEFLLLNLDGIQGEINVRLQDVFAVADINGYKTNIASQLFHLAKVSIPLKGAIVQLKSSVVLQETRLIVRELSAEIYGETFWKSFVQSQTSINIKNQANLRKLRSVRLIIDTDLETKSYNNLELKSISNEAVKTNEKINLEYLKVTTFGSRTITTMFFESHVYKVFMEHVIRQEQNNENNLVQKVILLGPAVFRKNVLTASFNNHSNIGEHLKLLAKRNDASVLIGGQKLFMENVNSEHYLRATLLNGFLALHIILQSLSRSEKQTISSEMFSETFIAENLSAKIYNDVAITQFVDKKQTQLALKLNLQAISMLAQNLDTKYSLLNVAKISEVIRYPKCLQIKLVKAQESVKMTYNKDSHFERIVKFAVFKVGSTQIIHGSFQSGNSKIFINNLLTPEGLFVSNSRVISFQKLFVDSLQIETKRLQKITGISMLLSPTYVREAVIEESSFYASKDVNNIDITSLNRTIVRPQTTIASSKHIGKKFHTSNIFIQEKLSLVSSKTFLALSNESQLPKLHVRNLYSGYLKTYTIHKVSLNNFLQEIMKKNQRADQEVTGILSFKALTLLSDVILSSINSVFINDAVFSQTDQLQDLTGHKIMVGKIYLQGPSTVKVMNNIDFTDFVKKRLLRSQDLHKKSLTLFKVDLISGISFDSFINGQKIEQKSPIESFAPNSMTLFSSVNRVRNEVYNINYTKKTKSKRLLYLDNNREVQFSHSSNKNSTDCLKNLREVFPLKFNEVVIRLKSDLESFYDLSTVQITVTPSTLCISYEKSVNKLDLDWTYKNNSVRKFHRDFSFNGSLTDVKILQTKKGVTLMIVTIVTNEETNISVYELDMKRNEWLETQQELSFNRVLLTHVIDTSNDQFLVVSSEDETSPSEKYEVAVFILNQTSNMIFANQRKLIGVKVDIILSISIQQRKLTVNPKTFLVLSESRSTVIYIYQFSYNFKKFIFQRKIHFESAIVQVVVIDVTDIPHFIVSLYNGQFCIFELRGIESWKVKQCGNFSSLGFIRPYEYLKKQHLFLMSEKLNAATALSIYQQGDLV